MKKFSKSLPLLLLVTWYLVVSFTLQLPDNARHHSFVPPDAKSYEEAADLLINGLQVSHVRPWGFALVTALGNLLGKNDTGITWFLWFIQYICWLGTAFLIFRVSASYLSGWKKYIPAAIFALSVSNIIFTWLTLSETVFTFCITLSVYLFWLYTGNHYPRRNLLGAFAALAFACVVRPSLQLPVLAMFAWLLYEFLIGPQKKPVMALFSALILLLTLGFQMIRMQQQYGQFTLSFIGKMAWYEYLGSGAEAVVKKADLRTVRNERDSAEKAFLTTIEGKDYWSRRMAFYDADLDRQMAEHKGAIAKAMVLNILQNTREHSAETAMLMNLRNKSSFEQPRRFFYRNSRYLNILFNYVALPVVLLLLAVTWIRRGKWIPSGSLLSLAYAAVLAFFLLLSSGASMWQGDRFSIVYYPVVLISVALVWQQVRLLPRKSP